MAITIGMVSVASFRTRVAVGPIRDKDVDREADQLGSELGQPVDPPLGVAPLDRDIPPLGVAVVRQALTEGRRPAPARRRSPRYPTRGSWSTDAADRSVGPCNPIGAPDPPGSCHPAGMRDAVEGGTRSLDQLGRLGKDRLRNRQTQRLCGLEIDHQVEFLRPLHR